jgi:hypothetical protein
LATTSAWLHFIWRLFPFVALALPLAFALYREFIARRANRFVASLDKIAEMFLHNKAMFQSDVQDDALSKAVNEQFCVFYGTMAHLAVIVRELVLTCNAIRLLRWAGLQEVHMGSLMMDLAIEVHDFNEKANSILINHSFQQAATFLALAFASDDVSKHAQELKSLMRDFNRSMEPYRTGIANIRNTLAAHKPRDPLEFNKKMESLDVMSVAEAAVLALQVCSKIHRLCWDIHSSILKCVRHK